MAPASLIGKVYAIVEVDYSVHEMFKGALLESDVQHTGARASFYGMSSWPLHVVRLLQPCHQAEVWHVY